MDIKTFNKKNIDLSPLGFRQDNDYVLYYCTPKGAVILANAGVDGIHYCTIPKFGETIFSVSPMNFGDCVHPIARNFEDLLRLLLHCADMAALEQCYAWDEEQFRAFLTDYPASEEQQTVLDAIQKKCGLVPMENAFAYIKELQGEFDLSKIPYTEDYYDPEMNVAAPEIQTEWQVFYNSGYRSKNAKGRPGKEIVLNSKFSWGDEIWHIPSVYSCSKGLVVDFCVEIEPERVKGFIDKWYPTLVKEENLTCEMREQTEQENPMKVDFEMHLQVNRKEIIAQHGTSVPWIPESLLPDNLRNEREAKHLIEHYGLDETRAWSFHRWSCPWATKRRPEIKSLKLKLERAPVSIPGIHFKNPSVGDVIAFTHPLFNTQHRLTVLEYEQQEFSTNAFAHDEYEYPTHHTAMVYTLEPELSGMNFQVRDCFDNENPKRKPKKQCEPQASYDACIAIIGGADGPTVVFPSAGEQRQHAALSALRFEPTSDVEWKITFREKLMNDIEIELINQVPVYH